MNGKNNIAIGFLTMGLFMAYGFLLLYFKDRLNNVKLISWLALIGIIMPVGILAEVYLGAPPFLVLLGAISIVASVVILNINFFKLK